MDAHCHLHEVKDVPGAIERARAAGVMFAADCASDPAGMDAVVALSKKHDFVLPCVGLGPLESLALSAERRHDAVGTVRARAPLCNAVGEIGLDYSRAPPLAEKKTQLSVFRALLDVARDVHKPAVVHSRAAEADVLHVLEERPPPRALLHWFAGKKPLIERGIALGAYFSVGPSVLSGRTFDELLALVPEDRLLFETDAPVPFSGKPSEPAWILEVAHACAKKRQSDPESLFTQVFDNACRFFDVDV